MRHDFGHRNYVELRICNQTWYIDQLTDKQFYKDMRYGICDHYAGIRVWICQKDADTFRKGVHDFGHC